MRSSGVFKKRGEVERRQHDPSEHHARDAFPHHTARRRSCDVGGSPVGARGGRAAGKFPAGVIHPPTLAAPVASIATASKKKSNRRI